MKEIVVPYLSSIAHLNQSTKDIHLRHLYALMDFALESAQDYDNQFVIRTWLRSLRPHAQRRAWSVLNEFFTWRILTGRARASPMVGIARPAANIRIFKPLSRSQIRQIFNHLDLEATGNNVQWAFAATRIRAMMSLAIAHGLRTGELLALDMRSWLRAEKLLIVHRKGGEVITVKLDEGQSNELFAWNLLRQAQSPVGEPALFIGWFGKRLNADNLIRQFERLCSRCGIDLDRGGLHQLRHSVAAILVDQGRTLTEVAQYLGHKNLSSTNYYLRAHFGQENTIGSDVLKSILDAPGEAEVDKSLIRPDFCRQIPKGVDK